MADFTPRREDLVAGIAAQSSDTINPRLESLITGDSPQLADTDETVANGAVLAAMTVVGFDGDGNVVEANGSTVAAIGVLPYAVDASAGTVPTRVYRQGVFNPDLLEWNAAYNTDALRLKAFEGAPSPTSIIIRKPETMTV